METPSEAVTALVISFNLNSVVTDLSDLADGVVLSEILSLV